ncbi:PREDICTED: 40S ribosomal protein S3a-like [Condylura cristata]|uniref:40S ribosomal protein S3a-like n=1 Tax=Condylura cristata TaxID=143302 RepID=UPI00064355B8|nr:PREDICTED: 40S ribosomal protein S3a-like [Condylura cristata]
MRCYDSPSKPIQLQNTNSSAVLCLSEQHHSSWKKQTTMKGDQKRVKKKVDLFPKKYCYDVKLSAVFNASNIGKTLVMRTQRSKMASDGLQGYVFEVNLADVQDNEVAFRKFKLISLVIHGENYLTNFYGMDLIQDKMCYVVKKWLTMNEAHVDVKTVGYLLYLFCAENSKKHNNQTHKTAEAQHQQVKKILKKMEIIT